jgi:hypothetical protein
LNPSFHTQARCRDELEKTRKNKKKQEKTRKNKKKQKKASRAAAAAATATRAACSRFGNCRTFAFRATFAHPPRTAVSQQSLRRAVSQQSLEQPFHNIAVAQQSLLAQQSLIAAATHPAHTHTLTNSHAR